MILFLKVMFLFIFTTAVIQATIHADGRGSLILVAVLSSIGVLFIDEVFKELS